MAKARSAKKPPLEWRMLRWILVTVFWRLPRMIFCLLAWLLRAIIGRLSRRGGIQEVADGFYSSYKWRRLRVDTLEANRERYGMLACECCGMVDATFHVDHIYPRSTHPELALDPANLQVLCDDCNIGKGTAYTTNWRGGDDPVPDRLRNRRWFPSRS